MANEAKSLSPLQVALLAVAATWLLFTFHEIFKSMLNVNEYASMPASSIATWILITDYSGAVGLIARGVISLVAVVALVMFFTKRLSQSGAVKVLRWLLVGEAIYWLALFMSGVMGFLPLGYGQTGSISMGLLVETGIPCMVESIAIPAAIIVLIYQLKPGKPAKAAINWAMILGTIYVFVFWLDNTCNWLYVAMYTKKGWPYVTAYPENTLSFILTTVGLLTVAIYAAYFTKKSWGTETVGKLNLRAVGVIVTLVGLYYLWNYLTWIFFGSNALWSDWFAWFLGHNMDLWLLAAPLIGLPLLLNRNSAEKQSSLGT
jgi:hypothetical protein